jgi:DNA helicase-2/ATP-dependent DNA helicase PcrA
MTEHDTRPEEIGIAEETPLPEGTGAVLLSEEVAESVSKDKASASASSAPGTKTNVEWKEDADPFALPEENKKRPREVSAPEPWLAEKEENAIQRELLVEIEDACARIHPSLVFYETDEVSAADLAQYSPAEAKTILESKSRLNKEQADAALRSVGDLNIKALAGTGKTSLLSASISYLIAIGVAPERIAISSHTVSAAAEIEGRIGPTLQTLFPAALEAMGQTRPATGTIHALAYREMIAHKHPKARWTILDEGGQFRIWKEAMLFAFPELATADLDSQIGEEMRLVDRIRGYDVAEARIPELLTLVGGEEALKKVAETYQKIKEARKLIDYTDLLREWAPIIIHPGYHAKWEYFFVDEFQDTNPLQKFLLKLLKAQGVKLVVCGDNRQSINSFTGSDPTSHESFFAAHAIPDAWLETNYRCSQEIIALANAVISSMSPAESGRLKAWDGAGRGEPARMVFTKDAYDRRRFLPPKEAKAQKRKEAVVSCEEAIRMFQRLREENPEEPQSVALLYRTNAQGGALEEMMAALNGKRMEKGQAPIPYVRKDYRRTALRNKTEKEILGILGAWCCPSQAPWEQLLLSPYFSGVGEVTARTIQRNADRKKPKSHSEAMEIFDGELTRRNTETIGDFFDAWEGALNGNPPGTEAAEERINTEEPYPAAAVKQLESWILTTASKKPPEPGSKKETEEAQRRSYEAGIFERIRAKAKEGKSLSAATAEITEENERNAQNQNNANRALGLVASVQKTEKEEGLILSTIHLAKGREYDGVVIHQVSRGSLPHFNALRFYENDRNMIEKGFRKYASFPSLQEHEAHPPRECLPGIGRTGIPESAPKNKIEEWEDHNNPLEEEKRLLYVAITRAKKLLTITSNDHNYEFLPSEIWEKLKDRSRFSRT